MARPRLFNSPEELKAQIEEYFNTLPDEGVPTTAGLSLHLGFVSRQSLYDYKARAEFSDVIKGAILRIESFYESALYKSRAQIAGPIFWLKNHGWTDRQTIETEGEPRKVEISFIDPPDED